MKEAARTLYTENQGQKAKAKMFKAKLRKKSRLALREILFGLRKQH